MLSYIDPILFPDDCEVLEVTLDRYVYNIFKNGSSSLRKSGFRRIHIQEVLLLDRVEVYVRDPFDRYVSGVQTYLSALAPDHDRDTVLKMISEFLFLNRHFALQFHWLVNLRRYCDPIITIRPLEELNQITSMTRNVQTRDQELVEYFQNNQKLHFYLTLDKALLELAGRPVKFSYIIHHIKTKHPAVYEEVIQRSREICTVLG